MNQQRLAAVAALFIVLVHAAIARSAEPIDIGSRRELFVDDWLIDRLENARLALHRPQPQEVAFQCDQPWETAGPGYPTVLRDGERYRMYYRCSPPGGREDGDERQVTCYAESPDGVIWTKPKLGLFEFQGSKENNIVWRGSLAHNFTPFRDSNPDCPEDEQYKAVGGVKWGSGGLWALVSPDGIHWRKRDDRPLPLARRVSCPSTSAKTPGRTLRSDCGATRSASTASPRHTPRCRAANC